MDGYDYKGFNEKGYNRAGFDKKGFDTYGYNAQGYDREGYDAQGYNHQGQKRPDCDLCKREEYFNKMFSLTTVLHFTNGRLYGYCGETSVHTL